MAPLDSTPALLVEELEAGALDVEEGVELVAADAATMAPPERALGAATTELMFAALAAVPNSSIVCDPSVGPLITPTIPSSQWPGKPQKNQIGLVSLIVSSKTLAFVPELVVKPPLWKPVPV